MWVKVEGNCEWSLRSGKYLGVDFFVYPHPVPAAASQRVQVRLSEVDIHSTGMLMHFVFESRGGRLECRTVEVERGWGAE